MGYYSGWRKSEILSLEWRQVDRQAQVVRLDPGTTKSGEGRTLPYGSVPELVEAIERQWGEHERLAGDRVLCPYVFHYRGKQLKSFGRAWNTACRRAGCPDTLFHDLRRSAVRNLIRAGVSENVAMEILGHKTPSIFRRYNITTEDDKREATERLAAQGGRNKGGEDEKGRVAESPEASK